MPSQIIVLSGPVGAGKSVCAQRLAELFSGKVFKSREVINNLFPNIRERGELQAKGERLDRNTGGKWLVDAFEQFQRELDPNCLIIVDAIRILAQVKLIRKAYGNRVKHIHITADYSDLVARYKKRESGIAEYKSYKELKRNVTESKIEQLSESADVYLNTSRCSREDVVVRAAAHLGLLSRSVVPNVDIMIGGQYGSEGKGHLAAYLAPEYDVLVRVGGPNAGHTVYEEPIPYKFHQLPSGTRCSDTKIVVGPGAVISLDKTRQEIVECQLTRDRLFIDPQAIIIEPRDIAIENKKLKATIGSTAQGVGSATSRKVLRTHAKPTVRLAKDIRELLPFIKPSQEIFEWVYANGMRIFLEGTQGTGLSIHHGQYPYVTSRDTSVSGCLAEAGIAPSRVRKIIMVCRTYPIRVQSPESGTSGPMKIELKWNDIAKRSGIPINDLLKAEKTTTTKRKRRVMEFDWSLFRNSVLINGPTDIALTFVDYITKENRYARRYEQLSEETLRFIEEIERISAAPVSLITTRFDFRSIIDRRSWQ